MPKQIIVHVGTHKCGSTALQSWAAINEQALARDGVSYPKTGRNQFGNHSDLSLALRGRRLHSNDNLWADFLTEISHQHQERVLVSGEEFSTLSLEGIQALRDMLAAYEVRVLLCLRPQFEVIRSQYSEWLRQFLTNDSFATFWRFQTSLEAAYDYAGIHRKWTTVFGTGTIAVIPFSESQARPLGVISAVGDDLGLRMDRYEQVPLGNASECAEVLILWRYLLVKLQALTGVRMGVFETSNSPDRMPIITALQRKYAPLLWRSRLLVLAELSETTRFAGYDPTELIEVQRFFAISNRALFEQIGTELWSDQAEGESVLRPCQLSNDVVRQADALFDEVMTRQR